MANGVGQRAAALPPSPVCAPVPSGAPRPPSPPFSSPCDFLPPELMGHFPLGQFPPLSGTYYDLPLAERPVRPPNEASV